jgi:hypothetical protein
MVRAGDRYGLRGMRSATTLWRIGPGVVLALDERLGAPVDSYVNGSQTWLTEEDDVTLEWRLHPVSSYRVPSGLSHYDVWEAVVLGLSTGSDPSALHLGDETRALTGLWDGLECFAAYGEEIEPQTLAANATRLLGRTPDAVGLVDHESIGDAWERSRGRVSIVDLIVEQLAR